jgi:hypothetical protein
VREEKIFALACGLLRDSTGFDLEREDFAIRTI